MGSLFRFSRASHAQSITADSVTIDVPAGRFLLLHSLEVTGMASAAAAGAELGIYRVTTLGSTGTPTTIVLKPVDPNGAAAPAGLTAKFGYTTQPVVEADPVWRGLYQPLGGKARYSSMLGGALEFWSAVAYQISIRGISGTPNIGFDGELEIK